MAIANHTLRKLAQLLWSQESHPVLSHDDLVSEARLRLIGYSGKSRYTLAIARNAMVDAIRRECGRGMTKEPYLSLYGDMLESRAWYISRHEDWVTVQDLCSPSEWQVVCLLREGRSQREAAHCLGLHESRISQILRQIRRKAS